MPAKSISVRQKSAKYLFYALVFFFFFGPISWLLLASVNPEPS